MIFLSRKRLFLTSIACSSSVFFSACTIGPKYQKPVALAPPVFKELAGNDQWKTATPSDGVLKGKWWELFEDPMLNKLEEAVSVDNFNVKQAEAQFREARATVLADRANYYPTVGTTPGITESSRGRGVNGIGGGTSTSFTTPFSATWQPDLWGRVRLSVESANANAQVSAADLENVRLSMQATLATDYFQLLSNDMELKLLNDTIDAYQKNLTLTLNRFQGGVASRSDVTLAQTQLYQTQAQATDLDVVRNQLEHAIAVITGQPPANLTLPRSKVITVGPAIPTTIPSQLLERRPDIAAQERLIAAANANIGIAQVAFYPTLSLTATGGFTGTTLQNLFTWGSRTWSLGPSLSHTFFDFGRRNAQLDLAVAQYDAAVAAYRQTVLTAFQQVEDNLSALRVLATEIEQQAKAVSAAEESLRLENERYKAGTDSYLNVITTQTIALGDEVNAVNLVQRRMAAAVNLVVALGGGWDRSQLPTPEQIRTIELGNPDNSVKVAQPKPDTQ